MNHIRLIGLGILVFVLSGCASIQQFYTEVPTSGVELVDYDGPLSADLVHDMSLEDLITNRAADDFELVGRADFNAPSNQDWTGAMIRKGRSINAEKIDYYTWYERTDVGTGVMAMPTVNTSTGTVWGPNGARSVTMTTTGSSIVPYNYSIPRNEYHVFFFKKIKHPFKFGAALAYPNDELAKKVGTRNALVIAQVIPRKMAWKNDLFKGDVILKVDGKTPSIENIRAVNSRDNTPIKLSIWRDGVTIEKTLVE